MCKRRQLWQESLHDNRNERKSLNNSEVGSGLSFLGPLSCRFECAQEPSTNTWHKSNTEVSRRAIGRKYGTKNSFFFPFPSESQAKLTAQLHGKILKDWKITVNESISHEDNIWENENYIITGFLEGRRNPREYKISGTHSKVNILQSRNWLSTDSTSISFLFSIQDTSLVLWASETTWSQTNGGWSRFPFFLCKKEFARKCHGYVKSVFHYVRNLYLNSHAYSLFARSAGWQHQTPFFVQQSTINDVDIN